MATSVTKCDEDLDISDCESRFVLRPVNGEARLTRVCSTMPLRSKSTPRLALDVDLPEISLNLTKNQYNQLLHFGSEVARWETRKQYRSGRPIASILENASVWWKWVITKQIEDVRLKRKQKSMEFILRRARLIVDYVKTYKSQLIAKYGHNSVDKQMELSLEEMRTEMTFAELAILHELVYNEIDEENKKKRASDQMKTLEKKRLKKQISKKSTKQSWQWGGWLGTWRSRNKSGSDVDSDEKGTSTESDDVGRDNAKKTSDDVTNPTHEMPESLFQDLNDEEIFEMFGDQLSAEDTTDTFLKRDSVLLKLNFMLKSGKLTLLQADQETGLVSLEFNDVAIKSEWRPRYNTHEIKLDLGSINLRDLNPLNTHFCDLVKPSFRKNRSTSPLTVHSPDPAPRKTNDSWANLFTFSNSKTNDTSDLDEQERSESTPVLSVTYEKLPKNSSHHFSDRLEVVTAPLCLTVVPGLTDRLKSYFNTAAFTGEGRKQGSKSETLATAAQERYELWMRHARAEVTNTVKKLMEGKETTQVSNDKWAVSLDIFAPDIIIPEDWSNSNCSVVVLSLGHMTFANHTEEYLNRINAQADYDSDDDDYATPLITPPTGPEMPEKHTMSSMDLAKDGYEASDEMANDVASRSHYIDKDFLTERMLWDKMYERYHLQFSDLQILVAPSRAKWDAHRLGARTPLHLIDRFSVELTAERRIVPTTDPNYPAIMITGNLPHLTLHISHKKVHTVLRCIDNLARLSGLKSGTDLPARDLSTPLKQPGTKSARMLGRLEKTINIAKANSKKLVCEFLINQISVVLEEQKENQIISVLEVHQIQTKFVEKPYDSTVSFSIYSLLLVDVMQQLGHDYELLLASHRSVYMDVDSGNILDSGNISPADQASSTSLHSVSGPRRSASDSSKVGGTTTNNILSKVAENLRQFTRIPDPQIPKEEAKPTAANSDTFQYLITLEIKMVRKDTRDVLPSNTPSIASSEDSHNPFTNIKANFSNLDVVFNAKSWVTLLNFLHRLKKPSSQASSVDSSLQEPVIYKNPQNEKNLTSKPSLIQIGGVRNDAEQKTKKTFVSIGFKKLNILLMRHIEKPGTAIGRKLATVTMQGAQVETHFGTQTELDVNYTKNLNIDVTGSIASLQMQDLTSSNRRAIVHGYEILSVGMHDTNSPVSSPTLPPAAPQFFQDQIKAFSFRLQQNVITTGNKKINFDQGLLNPSVSTPIVPASEVAENHYTAHNLSDTMIFKMDSDESKYIKRSYGLKTETQVDIQLASTCYIHSPRLVAELLACVDEVGDFVRAQMTTAARQAYKDMARSIMDKVSDYSKSVLHRSVDFESIMESPAAIPPATSMLNDPTSAAYPMDASLDFHLKIESPILAFPKSPGSFELLVANLGQITVQNECNNGSGPLDKLYINFENMHLRSHRQRAEELKAKKADRYLFKTSVTAGPSINQLKKDSINFMQSLNNDSSGKSSPLGGSQILHKTFLHLTVERKEFLPSAKSPLDVRHCCNEDSLSRCTNRSSCDNYISHVGPISEKKMCVDVQASSALTVTLSKPAYEQLLKTLDNISFGGDIDNIVDTMGRCSPGTIPAQQSASAPDLFEIKNMQPKLPRNVQAHFSSSTSYQSTPKGDKETPFFNLSDQELPASPVSNQALVVNLRKYTPISADISVPCLIFQLSGDLSDGEQGLVKVTLEGFTGAYHKENRFGTQINLSLGTLDIEDLLLPEDSKDRHIVLSYKTDKNRHSQPLKTVYLSHSCPSLIRSSAHSHCNMSTSLPSFQHDQFVPRKAPRPHQRAGHFRPYDSIHVSSKLIPTETQSQPMTPRVSNEKEPKPASKSDPKNDLTLVKIKVFLVDGSSSAYNSVYNRVNRNIDVDFNSLDCKVNLQTWVVLLDFFGIGTSPKKQYQLDPNTEKLFTANQQLDVRSFYENQPQQIINSEINFTVRSFDLTLNKQEYELLKANVAGLQSKNQIRDGMLRVCGQLASLSVSDLSPNGSLYRERFIFTGDKALDFDIKKFDEYDQNLDREFDISVQLRMSSIRYIHTQRFQNETVAYCQHFQQLQEVLGRMRAASVGQSVHHTSRRQARVLLDVEADAPIILIPESSHSQRLIVANLGHITVANKFKYDGTPGTLSHQSSKLSSNPDKGKPLIDFSSDSDIDEGRCLLDVILVDLIDMDLFTATYSKLSKKSASSSSADTTELVFPSYVVSCNSRPLLKEKVKLELQMERNLEKEVKHNGVPDTSMSARLSSVYCAINHDQYWLIRGILDHNTGETIPDFPQPTAFLQPSKEQTVLTGKVYVGLSMDFYLTNVSIELLRAHTGDIENRQSLARLDFVKSKLSFQALSDNNKTTNLSCEAFRAHDTRFGGHCQGEAPSSVFTTVLGAMEPNPQSTKAMVPSLLQFELFQRTGPGYVEFTALLNNMRVYLILDWLTDVNKYLLQNPNQGRCDSLRAKTAQLMARFGQVHSGEQQKLDSSGQLLPEKQSKEVKMNFTNTEFVLVEDTSRLESDGVILRSTAVLDYFPDQTPRSPGDFVTKPLLSCSLQRLEVFSCQLIQENETALSIVDPVTFNFEARQIKQTDLSQEEILSDPSLLDKALLDIQVSELNIRVSYNDVMLFMNIFKSITGKTNLWGSSSSNDPSTPSSSSRPNPLEPAAKLIAPLVEIGYSKNDVIKALQLHNGSVDRAGSWLVEHARLEKINDKTKTKEVTSKSVPLNIARLNLNAEFLRVCLIDDCAEDCDVPLTEMAVRTVIIRQCFADSFSASYKELLFGQMGSASFTLNGDYYNRMLSLWEPFLEPWRCSVNWRHTKSKFDSASGNWNFEMQAFDRFDVTVTSALMETVKMTLSTWKKDYASVTEIKSVSLARKRLPLVAYVLRNLTGSPLRFATQTAAMHEGSYLEEETLHKTNHVTQFKEVYPGEDCSFNFATMHEKQRHKRSESLKLHQIIVQVGEWKTFQPVTVSKVGVYFRHAFKQINKSANVYEPPVPVRVVFSVTLEGNAQKVVTVRSALTVRSRVKIPVQLQLSSEEDTVTLPILDPGDIQHIPLSLTSYSIKIRPCISSHRKRYSYRYSNNDIKWQLATMDKKEDSQLIECQCVYPNQSKFYFAVCTQRLAYPSYEEICEMLHQQDDDQGSSDWEGCIPPLPGHNIIILPPVVISNLLPCDLHYYVKNKNIEGTLKPGVDATPHAVHVSLANQTSLIVGCLIDGFQSCRELIVPAVAKNFQMRMLIKDYNHETLVLNVRVLWRLGCSVKVSVMAGYWVVNKTGLPIVVKQEGCSEVAAGQYDSHEQARSLQPLLFSYANRDAPYLCTMRLGRKARLDDVSAGSKAKFHGAPSFCERFSTDGGSCTRNLKLISSDGTPNREFCIGVSVRRGWGRYLHTHIVTIAPRFLLINRTQKHRLSFAQRHTISYSSDFSGVSCHLSIIPGSSCVFHWPRVDLDTLLCVKLADVSSCHWSGGFFIDKQDAFHIALRLASTFAGFRHSLAPHCVFLLVEVTLVNATYCVVVSDADPSQVPPPLRIDNVSFAPIIFKQVGADASYNTEVPPASQLAYACDEPCLAQQLTCSVRGDSSFVAVDMNVIGEEKQLYYKNYFYIAMGSTAVQHSNQDHRRHMTLVMDVQRKQKVYDITLQPLRSGKRSQLWRMTSDGRIFHEGSSPPETDQSSHDSAIRSTGLVLDIAEMALNVGRSLDQGIPLTLKSTDERRRSTQTWHFDDDHRLKCRHRGLTVQVNKLEAGQPIVLALFDDQKLCLPNQMCNLQKLIPGSGCLSLKVVRDGPTRVLRILDIRQKRSGIVAGSHDWTILETTSQPSFFGEHSALSPSSGTGTYNLSVSMPQGLGMSLISNSSEELLYLTMSGVNMRISADDTEQFLSLTMQKLQIDNQLLDGYPTVLLSPRRAKLNTASNDATSSQKFPSYLTEPVVAIKAIRQPTFSHMYEIYKSFTIELGKLSVAVEERLMLKLLYFMGYSPSSAERESELLDETKLDSALSFTNLGQASYTAVKRFYFDTLRLSAEPVRLSVLTASRLSPELKAVKQSLAVPLIQFERAPVALQDYVKRHLFETMSFVFADLSKHLREQLKSQAAIILGSIDFLGNPIGLLSDVKAGIHAVGQGNVQNMTKHITHGLSNSTAKFTGALSDKIGGLAMDEEYEDKRKAIQANARSSASGHVVAGLQGLMAGVVGGLTSVVTQPVKGAQSDGASGFVKGLFKGVVGTVTKPVTGVLDLASESASAVRHMSVSSDQVAVRARPIRCCHSFQGCLQYYSKSQAEGQIFLYALNSNDYSEHFYSRENLNNILVLITNKHVYFVRNAEPDADNIILTVDYSELVAVAVKSSKEQHPVSSSVDYGTSIFLELTMKSQNPNSGVYNYHYNKSGMKYHLKKPRVACHSHTVAERVCRQIQYAKTLASEQTETMQSDVEELAKDRSFELEV